ncbi:MAG: murein hydrolase activator EnvC family protein, partial [Endozoicomonas sp.]
LMNTLARFFKTIGTKKSAEKISTALFLSLLISFPQLSLSNEKTATEAELKVIENDIQKAKKLLESLNAERGSAEKQIRKNDKMVNKLNRDINSLKNRLREGQSEVKKLQSRQQVLMAKSEQQKQQVTQSLQSLYKSLGNSRIKLLLNQEDPEQVSRHMVYLDYFQKAQLRSIQEYEYTITELKSNEVRQQTLVVQLNKEKEQLDKKKTTLVIQQAERKKLLGKLSGRYKEEGSELKRLEKQRTQLDEVLAMIISRQATSGESFTSRKGKMLWPVDGRVLYRFNDQNPSTRMRWQGTFIAAETGSQVNAVHDGRVIFSDWLSSYGLLVILDHGDNFLTLYAHNDAILRQEGETVLAGEPIAMSGQSGGQTNEGVYFEVRQNGKPQNPNKWLGKQ